MDRQTICNAVIYILELISVQRKDPDERFSKNLILLYLEQIQLCRIFYDVLSFRSSKSVYATIDLYCDNKN